MLLGTKFNDHWWVQVGREGGGIRRSSCPLQQARQMTSELYQGPGTEPNHGSSPQELMGSFLEA